MELYKNYLRLKQRKISSQELVEEAHKNWNQNGNNSLITSTFDQAKERAKLVDKELEQGKGPYSWVHGIPYTLKDLFITKDIRTTAGSRLLSNYIPPFEGVVSELLQSAGGVLVGKNGCDEFGMGSTNENTPFGVVINPINKEKVAGGSSGGSCAAVAEGSCAYSIGTDTGGSIRLPANFCGIFGLRPSYGRISRFGQTAFASSLDQAAPAANSTLDLACVMEILTKQSSSSHNDATQDASRPKQDPLTLVEKLLGLSPRYLKGKKLGVCPDLLEACSPDVLKALLEAIDQFKSLGVEIVDVQLPHLTYAPSVYYIIAPCEASANLSRYTGLFYGGQKLENSDFSLQRKYGLGPEVKRRILLGTFALSSGHHAAFFTKACQVRRLIAQDFESCLNKADLLFFPVCAQTALPLGSGKLDPLQVYKNDLMTIPNCLASLPALAVPFGKDHENMPTGFQLIGKLFDDEEILKWGWSFESQVIS